MQVTWTKETAVELLRKSVGNPGAEFRTGQWECVDALVNRRQRILLVQRTGWGKSIVYFLTTRILRDRGSGPAIIISPLLALMRNQIDAAAAIGIRAVTINSANREQWQAVTRDIFDGKVDVLLISPERLANDSFIQEVLLPLGNRTGLLVVDEAHCISDWGHDFRPDYRRIISVIRQMPPNIPLLGTTATANNRVIGDVRDQLGDIRILRGPLIRESLALQNIRLKDEADRLAWLKDQIPGLPGTGIVYTLTTRDAEQVAGWLLLNGIDAAAYHSEIKHPDFPDSNTYRQHLEDRLLTNQLKVLVATTALGMGYDKPDLGFVIHYQAPGSVVAYYQQVGRAGRAISHARGILLSGREDGDIHEYFRRTAFPEKKWVTAILNALDDSDGLTITQLQDRVNLRMSQLEKVLKLLSVESPSPVIKEGRAWHRTALAWEMDQGRIDFLTEQRLAEWSEVQAYFDHPGCLMSFLRQALDDPVDTVCGKCANCAPENQLPGKPVFESAVSASGFLCRSERLLHPRKLIPKDVFLETDLSGNLEKQGFCAKTGRILARWGGAGWGRIVAENKHAGRFDDSLVDAVTEMIQHRWEPDPAPEWVTCIPSRRHGDLVSDFTRRLSEALGIPFHPVITCSKSHPPQKGMHNRFHQCRNLDGVFAVTGNFPVAKPVLLVDDMIDSGWTLTVAAALLLRSGSGPVFPMALATTAAR